MAKTRQKIKQSAGRAARATGKAACATPPTGRLVLPLPVEQLDQVFALESKRLRQMRYEAPLGFLALQPPVSVAVIYQVVLE